MTQSDYMMLSAINAGKKFRSGGREVRTQGENIIISLCGVNCASIDFEYGLITVYGNTLNSRKSAKVFNAILRTFTEASVKSVHGRWKIQLPLGMEVSFSGNSIAIPISREFAKQ